MARRLPAREARQAAIRSLEGYEDAGEELEELEIDDIAAGVEVEEVAQSSEELGVEESAFEFDVDELVEDAEDWIYFENVDSESDHEVEAEEEVETQFITSRDGCQWTEDVQYAGRRPLRNFLTETPGFRRGLHPTSKLEALLVIFDEIFDGAVSYTNITGRRLGSKWRPTTRAELDAFFGLHILAGALKAHHRPVKELWDDCDGHPLFRAVMSRHRFDQLKMALRFDDPRRRDRNDRLAPIRFVIEKFNENIQYIYKPGPHLTIDEMLVEFHGRVQFRQYIPTKPGKFGIKIYWITEADSAFPLRCLVYVGQQTLSRDEIEENGSHVTALTLKLISPFLNCGRNLTGDNFFTDIRTANRLLEMNTTYVGTVRNSRRFLPEKAKVTVDREKGDSRHFYSNQHTICSFWDKGHKPVNILSTMHGTQRNLQPNEGKPEIVTFYNSTKSGVDTLDKVVRGFSSKRKYRRWPVHVFFTVLDAGIYSTFKMMKSLNLAEQSTHYSFKKDLSYEMCMPFVRRRSQLQHLRMSVKKSMMLVGIDFSTPTQGLVGTQGRRPSRCHLCPRKRDRKTRNFCSSCEKACCSDHGGWLCSECFIN